MALFKKEKKNIVEIAVDEGKFAKFVTAMKAAGLADTLNSPGPFTVFAPTDDAFKNMPANEFEALLKDKEKLTAILTYHIIAGKISEQDAMSLMKAKTIQGQELKITTNGWFKINGIRVIKSDVVCKNGIIHEIDSVLIPN